MNKFAVWLLTTLLLSFHAFADSEVLCEANNDCIEIGRWDIGVALGYGVKENPLKDREDIPIYVAPTIAYYGDSWFFDNGNIGYTLVEDEKFTINLNTSFSTDSAYFYRWDPSNIFIAGTNQFAVPTEKFAGPRDVSKKAEPIFNELEDRNFTLLGGIDAFIYTGIGIINLTVAHDLFNVHSGSEAKFKWLYNLALDEWRIEVAALANWKSEEIINYYYSVRPSENRYWSEQYQAGSTTNLGLELTTQYVINEHWELVFLARYTELGDKIVESPLVNQQNTNTFFVGTAYRF
ncbi:MipA/OmpV family protein [Shewanella psychrotolerans]|uniref:MipA/OmpV family protein n=1 Tax=Shewanella psychrotolerans TaxID=2864206 RepID=UPI001C65CC24|nr:MipA/OmpV family protein [Shewanella psychrotolerans]QYK02181.1 MipA/OmpV family protein [Shewanella psychrotolerans]